ncbi:hypothetical protein QBC43DRAFT_352651 [Cladorrhinum sp. PSN259]|nr:hypothetical protein QBC43DRAFT_352651 [Cladorrhinum sp. PSN259]
MTDWGISSQAVLRMLVVTQDGGGIQTIILITASFSISGPSSILRRQPCMPSLACLSAVVWQLVAPEAQMQSAGGDPGTISPEWRKHTNWPIVAPNRVRDERRKFEHQQRQQLEISRQRCPRSLSGLGVLNGKGCAREHQRATGHGFQRGLRSTAGHRSWSLPAHLESCAQMFLQMGRTMETSVFSLFFCFLFVRHCASSCAAVFLCLCPVPECAVLLEVEVEMEKSKYYKLQVRIEYPSADDS